MDTDFSGACRWCGTAAPHEAIGCEDCFWQLPAHLRYRITCASVRGLVDELAVASAAEFLRTRRTAAEGHWMDVRSQ